MELNQERRRRREEALNKMIRQLPEQLQTVRDEMAELEVEMKERMRQCQDKMDALFQTMYTVMDSMQALREDDSKELGDDGGGGNVGEGATASDHHQASSSSNQGGATTHHKVEVIADSRSINLINPFDRVTDMRQVRNIDLKLSYDLIRASKMPSTVKNQLGRRRKRMRQKEINEQRAREGKPAILFRKA